MAIKTDKKTTTAIKTKKQQADSITNQNSNKKNITPANVDTNPATTRVRANAGRGLNSEGTNVSYEDEQRNG